MNRKTIYNPSSVENLNDRKTIGGNPDGMINFTRVKYEWASKLWDQMEANTWFPKEVQMTADAKDYKYLLPEEKRMYDLVLSQLIFMDSLQANNLMDNINPYITAPEINAILSRQSYEECLVAGHELLVKDKGWVDISDICEQDEVLSFNVNSKKSEFQHLTKKHEYKYSGELHHFKSTSFEQKTTKGHKIPFIDRNGKIQAKFACEFYNGKQGVGFLNNVDFVDCNKKHKALSDYDRFLIVLQADGTILRENNLGKNKHRNGNKSGFISCTFTFSKARKIERFKNILSSLKFQYVENAYPSKEKNTKDKTLFTVKVPKSNIISKDFADWVDIASLNKIYAKDFIHELKHWDGYDYRYKIKTNVFGYDTTNKDNADIVQALGVLAGLRVNYSISKDNRKDTFKDLYRLSFNDNRLNTSRNTVTKTVSLVDDIDVYCVTIKDGFFVVRFNNKVSITGNCNHSKSYAVMVESISDNTDEIYDMWKNDLKLREKNKFIAGTYDNLSGVITNKKIILAMFANQILEGLYFYAGFAAIYALGRSGKMQGSAQMIKFIQRDEVTHLLLFQNLINSTRKELPELFDSELEQEVRDMFRKAVDLEASWGDYITQGQILGFTSGIIRQYIEYLADRRLEAVGYKPEYNVKHPIPWVDGYSSFNDQRTNFFEGNVINYSKGSIDFEDF